MSIEGSGRLFGVTFSDGLCHLHRYEAFEMKLSRFLSISENVSQKIGWAGCIKKVVINPKEEMNPEIYKKISTNSNEEMNPGINEKVKKAPVAAGRRKTSIISH